MVAQQILRAVPGLNRRSQAGPGRASRRAGVLAAALLLTAGSAATAAPVEGIVVIDLRPAPAPERRADRSALLAGLAATPGLSVAGDAGLAAALGADPVAPLAEVAATALAAAAAAYGSLECDVAEDRAAAAIEALAALRAAGEDSSASLRQAHVYRLLCAHTRGDTGAALSSAARLRTLGADGAPRGVPDPVWQAYPPLDASTDRRIGELLVTTTPPGAAVHINLVPAGTAPLTAALPEGEHLVAVATGGGAAARHVTVTGEGATPLELTLPAPGGAHALAEVRSWRAAGGPPDPAGLGVLLGRLGVRFAAVIQPDGQVQLWGLGPGDTVARKMGAPVKTAAEIDKLVQSRMDAWQSRSPDPDLPLLREGDGAGGRVDDGAKRPHEWWVYASIIGAVAVGAAIILVNDLADDRQRFELTWP